MRPRLRCWPIVALLLVGCTTTGTAPLQPSEQTASAASTAVASPSATPASTALATPSATSGATCPPAPLPCADPSYAWGLGLNNGTALTVTLLVNGKVAGTYGPGTATEGAGIAPAGLPSLPWSVEARSPSGRVLVSMNVVVPPLRLVYPNGGGTSISGPAQRIDLSCGRLDIWAGPPLAGPAPGPGTPGDCAP